MRGVLVALALGLLAGDVAAQTCTTPAQPRARTVVVYGDSRMQGGLCSSTNPTSPPAYLDANLPGGANGGWLVKNAAVTGTTPAQQLTAYQNATTGEAKACNGERCAYVVVMGAANCLRVGTAPATCLASHITLVDDALSKGVAVLWVSETDYSLWASAGTNPTGQVNTYHAAWQAACAARAANTALKCLDILALSGVPKTNTCDGIHDNQAGTNALGEWLRVALLAIP